MYEMNDYLHRKVLQHHERDMLKRNEMKRLIHEAKVEQNKARPRRGIIQQILLLIMGQS